MVRAREGDRSGLSLFAAELQAARTAAGLSQAELAARLHYSESLVAMVESCRRAPTLDFASGCDEVFTLPGTFARLHQHARTTPLPSWFLPYAEIEAAATQLRLFEHAVVPGLLQTEDYARAVLAVQPNVTDDEVAQMVTARMDRQAVLTRGRPPLVWAVIDESALHRTIGGAKTMHEQLLHLADLTDRPNITIGVIPLAIGAHCGMLGAFAVADVDDASRAAYLETVTTGYIAESKSVVSEVLLTFDTLRSEALPRRASRDLIMNEQKTMDLTKAQWRKSSFSGSNGGNCVEVARNLPGIVAVRDSKHPEGGALVFSRAEWDTFLAGVQGSEFDT